MKTIKFFSFAMLLAFAWVSCKDANTTTTEATAEVMADSVLVASKATAAAGLTGMQQLVSGKITELEAAVATASDATSGELTKQLDTYKQYLADLQSVSTKVSEATAENWASVNTEVETVHAAVKSAIAGTPVPTGTMTTTPPSN